jgi:hypothetical protein
MPTDWSQYPSDDFDAAKIFAGDFYNKIGRIRSPALNDDYVAFNSKGLRHTINKATRTREEITERLSYLRFAEEIISDPFAKIEYRKTVDKERIKKQGNYGLYEVQAQYWTFTKEIEPGVVIKVVIRQMEASGKYFYSIMRRNDV